jgi:hypothetical protein
MPVLLCCKLEQKEEVKNVRAGRWWEGDAMKRKAEQACILHA